MGTYRAKSKIFKIVLFIGVFIYFLLWGKNHYGAIDIEVFKAAIIGSSIAYFLAVIASFIARLTENYVVGIIGTIIFVIVGLPKIGKALSVYVSDENQLYILIAFVVLALVLDIFSLIKMFRQSKQTMDRNVYEILESETSETDVHALLKNDVKFVLMTQNELEKKLGRKPSYDEIMEYIDGFEETNL